MINVYNCKPFSTVLCHLYWCLAELAQVLCLIRAQVLLKRMIPQFYDIPDIYEHILKPLRLPRKERP